MYGTTDLTNGSRGQLENLLATLRLVQDERELRIPAIYEQVQEIIDIGTELKAKLGTPATHVHRNKAKQLVHDYASGGKHDKDIRECWARLGQASTELSARILTAHVGQSTASFDSIRVIMTTTQRVDQNVQS